MQTGHDILAQPTKRDKAMDMECYTILMVMSHIKANGKMVISMARVDYIIRMS